MIQETCKKIIHFTRFNKMGVIVAVLFMAQTEISTAQNCLGTWDDVSILQAPYPPCAVPTVTYAMEIKIRVLQTIAPSDFTIGIEWGDGSADYTIAGTNGAIQRTAVTVLNVAYWEYSLTSGAVSHSYAITPNCRYDLKIYLQFRNPSNKCFSTRKYRVNIWSRDSEGMGYLVLENDDTHLWEYLVCEGKPFTITFRDLTHLACNTDPGDNDLAYDYDALQRNTQFIYGVTAQFGTEPSKLSTIPDVFVGTTRVTSSAAPQADGAATILNGPLNTIHPSRDFAVNEDINFPTPVISNDVGNTREGQVFNLQLNNWNVCNPQPDPSVKIDARIRVVASPPKPIPRVYEFCHSNHYNTTPNFAMDVRHESALGSMAGGTYRWYASDINGDMTGNPLYEGTSNSFNPVGRSTGGKTVSVSTAGRYIFWVTYEFKGSNTGGIPCTTDPVKMVWLIRDDITAAPATRNGTWKTAGCAGETFSVGYTNAPASASSPTATNANNNGATEYFWEVSSGNAIVVRDETNRGQTAQIQLTGNPVNGGTETVTIRVHREWVTALLTEISDLAAAKPACKYPTANTNYLSGNGCDHCPGNFDTYTITINPLPQANLVNPDAELCPADGGYNLTMNGLYGRIPSGTTNNLTATLTDNAGSKDFTVVNSGSGTITVTPAAGTVTNYQILTLKDNNTQCVSNYGENKFTRLDNGADLNLGYKITSSTGASAPTWNGYAQIRKRASLTTPTLSTVAPLADLCPGILYTWTSSALPAIPGSGSAGTVTLTPSGTPTPASVDRSLEYLWSYTGGLTGTTPVNGTANSRSFTTTTSPSYPDGTAVAMNVVNRYNSEAAQSSQSATATMPKGNLKYCPSDAGTRSHTVIPPAKATITNTSQTICDDNTSSATINLKLEGFAGSDFLFHWELEKTTGPGSVAIVASSGSTSVTVSSPSTGENTTSITFSPSDFDVSGQPRHGTYTFRVRSITQARGECAGTVTNTGTITIREKPTAEFDMPNSQRICEKMPSNPIPIVFNIANGVYTIKYKTDVTDAIEQTATNLPNIGATIVVPASQIKLGSAITTVTITSVTHTVGDQVCPGIPVTPMTYTIQTVKPKSAGEDQAVCGSVIELDAEPADAGNNEKGRWIVTKETGAPDLIFTATTVTTPPTPGNEDPKAIISPDNTYFGTYRLEWRISVLNTGTNNYDDMTECPEIVTVSFGAAPDLGKMSGPVTQCGLTAKLTGGSTGLGGGSGLTTTDGLVRRWETGVWALKSAPTGGIITTPATIISGPPPAGIYPNINFPANADSYLNIISYVTRDDSHDLEVTVSLPGKYVFVWFIKSPCGFPTAIEHEIEFIPFPETNQISNRLVCPNDPIDITFTDIHGQNDDWLIPDADVQYTWQFRGTSNTTNPTSLPNTNFPDGLVSPANNGDVNVPYTVIVTGTYRGCVGDNMTFNITVKPKPQLYNTGDKNICPDETANVSMNPPLIGNNAIYTWWYTDDTSSPKIQVRPPIPITGGIHHPNTGFANGTRTISVSPYRLEWTGALTADPVAESGKIRVIAIVNGCVSDTATINVTVKPRPIIEVSQPIVEYCSNVPVIQQGIPDALVEFWSEVASTSFKWKFTGEETGLTPNTELAAVQIPGENRYTTTDITKTIDNIDARNYKGTVTIYSEAAGCKAEETFNIEIKPRPVLLAVSIPSQSLCPPPQNTVFNSITPAVNNNTNINLEFQFDWTPLGSIYDFDPDPAVTANTSGEKTKTISGGSSWSGIDVPTATDGVNRSITLSVTPSMGGCKGNSAGMSLTALVQPVMRHPDDQEACSGELFKTINFNTNTSQSVTYSWEFSGPNVGKTGSSSGFIEGFTAANNTTGDDMTATVTVKATTTNGSCVSEPETFTYTVFPAPVINPIAANPPVFCPGEQVVFNDFSTNIDNNFTGTRPKPTVVYDWKVNNPNVGIKLPNYTVTDTISMRDFIGGTNTTGANIGTSVVVDARSSDISPITGKHCASLSQFTFPLTLKPAPKMNTVTDKEYCPNFLVQGGITLEHNISTSRYEGIEWEIDNTSISQVNGTTPALSSQGGNSIPTFYTQNPNSTPDNYIATVKTWATINQCLGEPITFKITIIPTPDISIPSDMFFCVGEQPGDIVFNTTFPGAKFLWERTGDVIGLSAGKGENLIPNFTTENHSLNSLLPQISTFTVWSEYNKCESLKDYFSMTVLPVPRLASYPGVTACAGDPMTPPEFDAQQKATGYDYTFEWKIIDPVPLSNVSPFKEWQLSPLLATDDPFPAFGDGNLPNLVGDTTRIKFSPDNNNLWGVAQQRATIEVTPYVSLSNLKTCKGTANETFIAVNPLPITIISQPDNNCIKDDEVKVYYIENQTSFPNKSEYFWTDGIDNPGPSGKGPVRYNVNTDYVQNYQFPSDAENWKGYIEVRERNAYGCTGPATRLNLSVIAAPKVSAGPNRTLCEGDTVHLHGKVLNFDPNVTYIYDWYPTQHFDASQFLNIPDPVARPRYTDRLMFRVEIYGANCRGDDDWVTLNVIPKPSTPMLYDMIYCDSHLQMPISASYVGNSNTPSNFLDPGYSLYWFRSVPVSAGVYDTIRISTAKDSLIISPSLRTGYPPTLVHPAALPSYPINWDITQSQDTIIYYQVMQTNVSGAYTCRSDLSYPGKLTIRRSPTAPIGRDFSYCEDPMRPRYNIFVTPSESSYVVNWYNQNGVSVGGSNGELWVTPVDLGLGGSSPVDTPETSGSPATYMPFRYYAEAFSGSGCPSPRTEVNLTVYPNPVLNPVMTDKDRMPTDGGCSPFILNALNNSPGYFVDYQWSWDAHPDSIDNAPRGEYMPHTYYATGSIPEMRRIVLTGVSAVNRNSEESDPDKGFCRSEIISNLTITPGVIADFFADIHEGCDPLQVIFNSTSTGAYKFRWYWNWQDPLEPPYPNSKTNPGNVIEPNVDDPNDPYYGIPIASPWHSFENKNLTTAKEYHIWFQVDNGACYDQKDTIITVFPVPNARFSHNLADKNNSICPPDSVLFINESSGLTNNNTAGGTQYVWNYSDGAPVTTDYKNEHWHLFQSLNAVSPIQTIVTLNAQNRFTKPNGNPITCSSSFFQTIYVNPQVKADFRSDSAGCSPATVIFYSQTIGTANTFIWDFNDPDNPDPGSGPNPSRTFTNERTHDEVKIYNVKLTASNNYDCRDVITKPFVLYPEPIASFTPFPISGCQPLEVTFYNTSNSTGAPNLVTGTTYKYDFNDASSSGDLDDDQQVKHEYINTLGSNLTMRPSLTVTNQWGCVKTTPPQTITIFPFVKADFLMEDSVGCSPLTIRFRNASQGYSSYIYDFGDGSVEPGTNTSGNILTNHNFVNPSMYRDTAYYVTLTVTAGVSQCSESVTQKVFVRSQPVADFLPESPYPNPYYYLTTPRISLDNRIPLPDRDYLNYVWSYVERDSYIPPFEFYYDVYPTALTISKWGIFDVKMFVAAPNNICKDSVMRTITIIPPTVIPGFKDVTPVCMPEPITFINESEWARFYEWDFGDKTATSSAINPVHYYTDAGTYLVTLHAIGETMEKKSITKPVVVHPLPQAGFTIHPNFLWVGQALRATSTSSHQYSDGSKYDIWYRWDWGDNTDIDTDEQPSHIYLKPGSYTISLTVGTFTDPVCSTSAIRGDAVGIEKAGDIIMPNVFKPDPDVERDEKVPTLGHKNYLFYPPVLTPVRKYHFMIYSRTGQLLFETTDPDRGWNGYFRGRLCDEGVYVFKIEGVFETGQSFTKMGDITLLR